MAVPIKTDVALFAHIVCRPEEELDLAQAALLLAEPEYPGLDLAHYLGVLDDLAVQARTHLLGFGDPVTCASRLVTYLAKKFRGNTAHYDDPRNSFLNEVLDRHLGIPITLAVVLIEVGRRVDVPLQGIGFPGHFLVRGGASPEGEGEQYLDPFDGRTLTREDLRDLVQVVSGEVRDPTPEELKVATKRAILVRMLNNLRHIYTTQGDAVRLRLVMERLRVLESWAKKPVRGKGLVH